MIESLRIVRCLRAPESVRHVADVDDDFELRHDGELDLEAFRALPNVSVYALDHDHGGVAFVETDPDADLTGAAFLHQSQRNHAQRVFRVPYDDFHALADSDGEAGDPIFIHSVGRCGSTLISDMLRAVPGIASLSEPDLFTCVERAVATGALRNDDAVRVLASACRLATRGIAQPGSRPVLKFRSEVAWIARQLNAAVPDARTLFMYRDARRVIESYLRVLGRNRGWSARLAHVPVLDEVVARRHRRRVERRGARMQRFAYVLTEGTPLEIEARGRWGKFLLQWLAKVHSYLDLHTIREDLAALRYEDLVGAPEPTLREVFEFFGLPDHALEAAVAATDRDSQRGTAFQRGARNEWHLTDRDEREILRTFHDNTHLSGPDVILPGTLTPH